jgi:hypothetical protein
MIWRLILALAFAFSFVATCEVLNHHGIATSSTFLITYPGALAVVLIWRLFQPNVPTETYLGFALIFAVNVVLYSALILGLLALPGAVKRRDQSP